MSTKSKSLLPSRSVSPSLLAVITNSCPITMQITGYRAVTCVCKGQTRLCFRVSLLIPVVARGLKPIGRRCHGFTYRQGHLHLFKSQPAVLLIIGTYFSLQDLCEVELVDKFLIMYCGVYGTLSLEYYFGPPEPVHTLILVYCCSQICMDILITTLDLIK